MQIVMARVLEMLIRASHPAERLESGHKLWLAELCSSQLQLVAERNNPEHYQHLRKTIANAYRPINQSPASISVREFCLNGFSRHPVAIIEKLFEVQAQLEGVGKIFRGRSTGQCCINWSTQELFSE